MRELEAAAI